MSSRCRLSVEYYGFAVSKCSEYDVLKLLVGNSVLVVIRDSWVISKICPQGVAALCPYRSTARGCVFHFHCSTACQHQFAHCLALLFGVGTGVVFIEHIVPVEHDVVEHHLLCYLLSRTWIESIESGGCSMFRVFVIVHCLRHCRSNASRWILLGRSAGGVARTETIVGRILCPMGGDKALHLGWQAIGNFSRHPLVVSCCHSCHGAVHPPLHVGVDVRGIEVAV